LFRSLFGRKKKPSGQGAAGDSVRYAAVGDVFTLTDLSIEYEDSYFIIEKINRYSSVAGEWYEVLGVDGDKRLWVYWSDQGGLSISIMVDERPMGLAALGLDDDTLIRMDDEQSIDNNVTIDGTKYYYRASAESTFYQDNTGDGEGFYLWDLASEDSSRSLSIDKWEGLPFQGHFSEVVPAESLSLYKR